MKKIGIALLLFLLGTTQSWAVVRVGAESLLHPPHLERIQQKRVGVLAHHASRLSDGTHLVDLLFHRQDLDLKIIFAPEHGLRSVDDAEVPDGKDPVTGLPVVSLYGPRRAPTPEQLAGIDVLIVDLQDVGVRFYTYSATLAHVLSACARAHVPVMVLDRPNPLNGTGVEGVLIEEEFRGGLTSFHPVTMRHGMSLGELAVLYNQELKIGAELVVVPMQGWDRSMFWEDTGLKWFTPSPALPTSEQGLLYGFFGAMESLPIAVGRSKTNAGAFRVYGAPWITKKQMHLLTERLNALYLPGLSFSPAEWIAERSEFEGKRCRGFQIKLQEAAKVEGFRSLLEIIKAMRSVLGEHLALQGLDRSLGKRWLRQALEASMPTSKILVKAQREKDVFLSRRKKALLY